MTQHDEQRGIVVIDYYRMHLQAEERKREAAIRRAVIEELAREAEAMNDNRFIFDLGLGDFNVGWEIAEWLLEHSNCGGSATVSDDPV